MYKLGLLRKSIAAVSIVPLALVGLAGCAGTSGEGLDERTRAPKATAPESESAPNGSDTGEGLPFPFADDGGEDAGGSSSSNGSADSSGSGSGGTGGSGDSGNSGGGSTTGGGNGVVKYDNVDLSNVTWSTICSTEPDSQYVLASDVNATTTSDTGAAIMVSADENGKPDYLFVSTGGDTSASNSLYWSSTSEGGSVKMSFSGDTVTATGEGFYFDDYSYSKPISFEIKLTCDTVY